MSTATETITVVVTGANPATYTYPVSVDIQTGTAANLSIILPGTHSGTDQVVATMTSHTPAYASNTADVAWQQVSGNIAVSPVTIVGYNNSSGAGFTHFATVQGTITGNSLIFNQVLQNTPLSGYCEPNNVSSCGGGYKKIPMDALQQTSAGGAWASNLSIPGSGSGSTGNKFVFDATGYLIVNVAATYTLYMTFANVAQPAFWIGGGATVVQTGNTNGGANPFPAAGPNTAFWTAQTPPTSALAMASNENPGLYGGTVSAYIKFPAPGKYPFELYYNQSQPCQFGGDNNSYVQIIYGANGGTIYANNEGNGPAGSFPTFNPVSVVATPPTGTAPTGVLQLTPTGGAPALQLQGNPANYALTLKIGPTVAYTVFPYIPLLEGHAGHLYITNNGSTFAFQTYNGNAITGNGTRMAAAATDGVVNLSGDNTSWQGRLSVTADASNNFFDLAYGGASFDSGVAKTELTIAADDVAWFFPTGNAFDLFTPSSSGGGTSLGIEVDYMANPGLNNPPATVSPTSGVSADGGNHTFSITLSKPFSPQQQGTVGSTGNTINAPVMVLSGGATFAAAPTPVINGAGFLTGWTVPVTIPKSTVNGSFTLTLTVNGTLTYLSGTTFTTGTVTYISSYVTTISTVGVQYVNPVAYSWSTVPASGDVTGTVTLNAKVYTFDNNAVNFDFYRQPSGGGSATKLNPTTVAGTISSPATGTVSGKTVYYRQASYTATIGSDLGSILLGYTATDAVSVLAVTYYGSTAYTTTNTGGGGGGCPAVEMFIDEWHQASDVFEGMALDTLAGEANGDYFTKPILTEARQVQWFEFSEQPCYRLVAENGAEVVVSGSTPVPTKENIEEYERGVAAGDLKFYASDMAAGMHVITGIDTASDDEPDRAEWSRLVEVTPVGMRRVCRLYCGGRNFAAGAKPGRYIYTHNILPSPK